jgi:hypothetical protein
MDVAAFHKTEGVLDSLRKNNITSCLIPPGLTSLLQPLDTAVNKSFKKWLQEAVKEYVNDQEKKDKAADKTTEWSVSDKRIMTTWAVLKAAKRLKARLELVSKALQQCGISIRPDGSEDALIRIKDIPPEAIDLSGWEEQEETIWKEEAMVDELEDEDTIYIAGDDEDDFHIGLLSSNVAQLKELLREAGLPISGNKVTLITRLQGYYHKKQQMKEVIH